MKDRIIRRTAAVLTLLAAAVLSIQTVGIYRAGVSPENLTESGVYIRPVYAREDVLQKLGQSAPLLIAWLAVSILGSLWVKEESAMVRPPREAAKTVRIVGRSAAVFCGAMIAGYLVMPSHFAARDLERVMGRLLAWTVPWLLAGGAALAAAGETKLSQKQARRCRPAVQWILAAAGVILLILGVGNRGARDVWVKAINICTECIGLG